MALSDWTRVLEEPASKAQRKGLYRWGRDYFGRSLIRSVTSGEASALFEVAGAVAQREQRNEAPEAFSGEATGG